MIIHDMEQGTDEWFAARCGIPTASNFKNLITSTGAPSKSMGDYARVLAAEKFAGHPVDVWEGNRYTDRGKDLEDHARNWYESIYDVETTEIGFVTDDLGRYGCSPDRLVGDDGLLEIKCQIAKEHIKSREYYADKGKPPTSYVAQCQGQLYICERNWLDLVFYHPDLPCLTIRITPDTSIISGLRNQLGAVIKERDSVIEKLNRWKMDE